MAIIDFVKLAEESLWEKAYTRKDLEKLIDKYYDTNTFASRYGMATNPKAVQKIIYKIDDDIEALEKALDKIDQKWKKNPTKELEEQFVDLLAKAHALRDYQMMLEFSSIPSFLGGVK